MNMQSHWAMSLIGMAWTPTCNCWWLVQHYFQQRHGVTMPEVAIGALSGQLVDNVASIKAAAEASGWRPAQGDPIEDDVVLMRGPQRRRHVGVMVAADGKLGLLHNDGTMTAHGPRGGVKWEPLKDAASGGYGDFEIWRRA